LSSRFERLEDVIRDECFPEVDMMLRRGRHIGRDDGAAYELLVDGLDHLEPLYRRFGAELVYKSDGYFYLLPSGTRLGSKHLSAGAMLAGQALALLYLDPSTLAHGGIIAPNTLLQRLEALVGQEGLVRALLPQRRKNIEHVAGENVRENVLKALRVLDRLGFIDLLGPDSLRLRPALMRFAEHVRSQADPAEALTRMASQGEIYRPDDVGLDDGDDDE
jgi:chromosome partition protein MukE